MLSTIVINNKIVIYTGVIPSTTFIEHLIQGVSKGSKIVLLFGELKKKGNYNKSKQSFIFELLTKYSLSESPI